MLNSSYLLKNYLFIIPSNTHICNRRGYLDTKYNIYFTWRFRSFLYGMTLMGEGLERAAGERLKVCCNFLRNRFLGVL